MGSVPRRGAASPLPLAVTLGALLALPGVAGCGRLWSAAFVGDRLAWREQP